MKTSIEIALKGKLFTNSVEGFEKHLLHSFVIQHNLDISKSKILTDYFSDFVEDERLLTSTNKITKGISIEDLVDIMGEIMPDSDKQTNGAFFTPKYIVDYIINFVSPKENELCADISCGCGAFLLGLVKYYTKQYHMSIKDILRENVFGYDILDYNVRRCKLILSIYAMLNGEIVEDEDLNLYICDSVRKDWNQSFNIIVGNPPYVKFQDMDDDTRSYLSNNYETTKRGTYNLYFSFFELGFKLLKDGGRLGYITPNNFFTSLSAEPLRAFFDRNRCISHIIDFSSTKVFSVQTYTAITFLNKANNQFISFDRIGKDISPKEFLNSIHFTHNCYKDLSSKKWRLLCGDERENIFKIEHCGFKLGDIFDIYVGVATLKDDAYTFVPSDEDASCYYVKKGTSTYMIEKEATRPLVKISEIKCQDDLDNNRKRIIFPYYLDDKNSPQLIEEDEFSSKFPGCYEYLLSEKEVLEHRGKGKHTYIPFYRWGRVQTMNKRGKKLLTPTFSQYPRFLMDNWDEGLFTNGYGIYPQKESHNVETLFSDMKPLISSPDNMDVLQKILNSNVMHYYVKKTSVSIEGGYPCYQKNFIERFSIPDLSKDEISYLRKVNDPLSIDTFLMNKYQINLPTPNLF